MTDAGTGGSDVHAIGQAARRPGGQAARRAGLTTLLVSAVVAPAVGLASHPASAQQAPTTAQQALSPATVVSVVNRLSTGEPTAYSAERSEHLFDETFARLSVPPLPDLSAVRIDTASVIEDSATRWSVDGAVAARRLSLQEPAVALQDYFLRTMDDFAGGHVLADGRLAFRFVDDGGSGTTQSMRELASTLVHRLSPEDAVLERTSDLHSYQDLYEDRRSIHAEKPRLAKLFGFDDFTVGMSVAQNAVSVRYPGPANPAFEVAVLAVAPVTRSVTFESGLALAEAEYCGSDDNCADPPPRGGVRMDVEGIGGTCSTGFTAIDLRTGDRGILTAGHCVTNDKIGIARVDLFGLDGQGLQTRVDLGRTIRKYDGGQGDITFIKMIAHFAQRIDDGVYVANGRTNVDMARLAQYEVGFEGAAICVAGYQFGEECGTLADALDSYRDTNTGILYDGVMRGRDICTEAGDSGGAWHTPGGTAWGGHSGGSAGTCVRSVKNTWGVYLRPNFRVLDLALYLD